MAMIDVQIQLEEQQYHVLKELSAQHRVAIAELVRAAVDMLLRQTKCESTISPDERRRAIAAVGRFRSEKADLAANHDVYFTEAIIS